MFNTLKIRRHQGYQAIRDVRTAEVDKAFRGLPVLDKDKCKNCSSCQTICPTGAITNNPFQIDLGRCVFCGDCERKCPDKLVTFTNFHKISSTSREHLIVGADTNKVNYETSAIESCEKIKKIFGRSLKLRQVSAGGCNGCEMELNACSNVNLDMGRFGIDFVASPRHADGLVITGPITEHMASALEDAYISTPDPKIVILVGACAISGGVFKKSRTINRAFLDKHKIDLYVPGCPIHPLTFINGVLGFLGR